MAYQFGKNFFKMLYVNLRSSFSLQNRKDTYKVLMIICYAVMGWVGGWVGGTTNNLRNNKVFEHKI